MRGQSFAGHALTDASATGGSGALLDRRQPSRSASWSARWPGPGPWRPSACATSGAGTWPPGIVLGASIGLAVAVPLPHDEHDSTTTGATQQILFGSIFVTALLDRPRRGRLQRRLPRHPRRRLPAAPARPRSARTWPPPGASRSASSGWPTWPRWRSAVGLSSLAIGAILSTALLIGPAATALRLTKRMGRALAAAAVLGVATTWLGVLLAYDSADWGSGHDALPVSFCVVALVFVALSRVAVLSSRLARSARAGRGPAGRARPGVAVSATRGGRACSRDS